MLKKIDMEGVFSVCIVILIAFLFTMKAFYNLS
ncbi:MAG: hypothetical protein K0R19_3138 [Bacillota bacterium]|nr:hypothetical protein [Bacillota bacterium]